MAVQQHLWGEVAAAVQPADSASPLHAAMVESAFASVACATQQAWDGLMQDLLQLYRSKIGELGPADWGEATAAPSALRDAASGPVGGASSGGDVPALMLLACSRLRGLVVLCAGGPEARAAAQAQVAAADPASAGLPMSKVGRLLLAAMVQPSMDSPARRPAAGPSLPACLAHGLPATLWFCIFAWARRCGNAGHARLPPSPPSHRC